MFTGGGALYHIFDLTLKSLANIFLRTYQMYTKSFF